MMFPREEHRCATIDESGRIEFGLGFAEDKKKREHAETTIVSIDRFEQVRCCALNFV